MSKIKAYIISDGTAITAETYANSILARFASVQIERVKESFINTKTAAQSVAQKIEKDAAAGYVVLAFASLVDDAIASIIRASECEYLDIITPILEQITARTNLVPNTSGGMAHTAYSAAYNARIEAINFTLEHDDGQFVYALDKAELILIGVSRCAKTPTSLYLAMQYGIKVANFPLTPDDFARCELPSVLAAHKHKLFGLSIDPYRLAQIRHERMPNSQYASLINCKEEVREAERLMRLNGIEFINSTSKSIEEISAALLKSMSLNQAN